MKLQVSANELLILHTGDQAPETYIFMTVQEKILKYDGDIIMEHWQCELVVSCYSMTVRAYVI